MPLPITLGFAFLRSPLGRRLAIGLALALLLAYVGWKVRSHYIAVGEERVRQGELKTVNEQLDLATASFEGKLAAAEHREAEAVARWENALARETAFKVALDALASQRRQAADSVARVTDEGLVADLRQKLAVAPDDHSPTLMPRELREADRIITDYPHVLKRLGTMQVEGQAVVDEKLAAIDQRLRAVEQQRDLAFGYADTVMAAYREVWNLAAKPKRRASCLWLCKKADKLPVPGPEKLLANRPKVGP